MQFQDTVQLLPNLYTHLLKHVLTEEYCSAGVSDQRSAILLLKRIKELQPKLKKGQTNIFNRSEREHHIATTVTIQSMIRLSTRGQKSVGLVH